MIIENLCIGEQTKEAELVFDHLELKSVDNYSALVRGYCEANHTRKTFDLVFRLLKQGTLVSKSRFFKLLCKVCVAGDNGTTLMLFETMHVFFCWEGFNS
ncbi:hypothetical protein CsatB_003781 [Cannabis sativa]